MVVKLNLDDDADALQFVPKSKRICTNPSSSSDKTIIALHSEPLKKPSSIIPEWRIKREAAKLDEEMPVKAWANETKWTEKSRSTMEERDWRIMRADLEVHFSVVGSHPSLQKLEPLLCWSELSSPKLTQYLTKYFPKPTPVQRCAIELVLKDQNAVIKAPTGSGKTLGFLVPFFEKMPQRALVLAPTRELAVQIGQQAQKIGQFVNADFEIAVLVGGLDLAGQARQLSHQPKLIVATPGRLLDFLGAGEASIIGDCDYLVFDEADRMVDLGFEPQITAIMKHLHSERRQMLMFSATWPPSVEKLGRPHLGPDYAVVQIGRAAQRINQQAELVSDDAEKYQKIRPLLLKYRPSIVFVRTKEAAQHLSQQLNDSVRCAPLHGNLGQEARNDAISNLKSQKISCLVATDVASRGVDIPGVALVVNYDLPNDIETYIHRIGRTGRAGSKGKAISFVTKQDAKLFPDLRRVLRQAGVSPTF